MKKKIAVLGGGIAALTAVYELTNREGHRDRFDITIYQMGHRLGGKGASGCNAEAAYRIEEHGLHVFWGFYENAFRMMRECYEELGRPRAAPLATFEDAFLPQDLIVIPEKMRETWEHWPLRFPRNDGVVGGGLDAADLLDQILRLLRGMAEVRFAQDLDVRGKAARDRWVRVLDDLLLTILRGLVADGLALPPRDWFRLDDESLRDWLTRHGAREETVASALLEGLHASLYAARLDCGAGTALHGILRLLLTYKGSVLYKMRAGMGETIFAPLYQVLLRRGVRFAFFHAVDRLELSADQRRVERVTISRQATPKSAVYQPLIDVGGLPCWPSKPLFEQLLEGEQLRAEGHDLENWWGSAPVAAALTLEDRRDFDEVILGISIGALRELCPELIADPKNPRFAAMVENIATTPTQSAQLWFSPELPRLGWEGENPMVIPYAPPMDTWADMSHLLDRERWPASSRPGSLAYLTARLDEDEPPPPRGPSDYPARLKERIRANTEAWLRESAGGLWPRATTRHDPGELNWHWLVDPENREGPARLEAQYIAGIMNPSDRYVLARAGTNRYRLRADESGYENLLLAGDWTLNSMSAGCVESAVMSGQMAARAVDAGARSSIGDWLAELDRAKGAKGAKAALARLGSEALRALSRPRPEAAATTTTRSLSGARREKPRYVVRDGELLAIPPIALDLSVSMFVLRADPERLTALLSRQLNHGGKTVYRPLGPLAVLYCSRVDNRPVKDPFGWVPEIDFGFWIPAVAGEMHRGVFSPRRLVTFTPYIWVNNDIALTNGRAFFGFAKDLGQMQMPEGAGDAGVYSLTTQVIPRFHPTSVVEQRPLFEVRRVDEPTRGPLRALLERGGDMAETMGAALGALRGDELSWNAGLGSGLALLRDAPRGMRMVFLKQFPDVVETRKACYQAVVEADIRITSEVKGGALPGRWETTIEAYDSHHIVDTLGLHTARRSGRSQVCSVIAQGEARFHASVEPGEVLWEA